MVKPVQECLQELQSTFNCPCLQLSVPDSRAHCSHKSNKLRTFTSVCGMLGFHNKYHADATLHLNHTLHLTTAAGVQHVHGLAHQPTH